MIAASSLYQQIRARGDVSGYEALWWADMCEEALEVVEMEQPLRFARYVQAAEVARAEFVMALGLT